LHHEAKSFSLPAVKEKVFFTTNERKQMSTKTTLKRVALVAVSALGFGLLSSVSANAGASTLSTEYVTSIAATTSAAPVAGALGASVTHTVYFKTSGTNASRQANPSVLLDTKPSTSTMTETTLLGTATYNSGAPLAGYWKFATASNGTSRVMGLTPTLSLQTDAVNGDNYYGVYYLNAYYDVAGAYKWVFWDDLDNDGVVDAGEFSTAITVNASSSGTALTGAVSAQNSTTCTAPTYGNLVKITVTDSSGNPAAPASSGGVKVSLTGSGKVNYVNGTNVTDASEYTLGQGDFDGSGRAWINVSNASAETVSLTLSGVGGTSLTAPSALGLTSVSCAGTVTDTPTRGAATSPNATGLSSTYTAAAKTTTVTLKTGSASSSKDDVTVVDTSGKITGKSGVAYDLAVAGSSTATYPGAFSITAAFTGAGQTFTVAVGGGTARTITSAARIATTLAVTGGDVIRAAQGAAISFTANCDDQFGANMADVTITPAISGRNSTLTLSTLVTNASGDVTFTYTDASTSTTALTDNITLSGCGGDTATVNYTSAADLGASTIVLTTAQTDSTGAVLSTYTDFGINAGDGAQAGQITVTATVKDANGIVLAGVPVSFSVAGSGVAIRSTSYSPRYTDATGVVTASVYAWVAGSYVVTATTGTKSDTVPTYWSQTDGASYTRTISATTSGRVITATAKDRFGNVAAGAAISARVTSGDCFFGTGTNTAEGTTAVDGTLKFIMAEGGACEVTLQAGSAGGSVTYAQTDALKGTVSTNDPLDVFTATTTGTTTTGEVGVGASFDAAGVNKVVVAVAAGAPTKDAADAASDAAAEAIDAANAATDAANLAAEAADAATVAAEEARDAADAATAAVEELATQVATLMAALKAQITTLANTVAKIAKKVKA